MYSIDVAERSSQGRATLFARQQHLEVEGRLVEAARLDPHVFGMLYECYADGVYSYIYRRVGDRTVAEDLVGETFARALAHLPNYEWRGLPFSSWLYRIASNHIATYYRQSRRMAGAEALERLTAWAPGPEQVLAGKEWSDDLLAAVRALPADQQQVIVLRFGQDLRHKEIGRLMGRSEGAVKALLRRALSALRRLLAACEDKRCAMGSNEVAQAWGSEAQWTGPVI